VDAKNALVTIYDGGKPVQWKWETFDLVRKRLETEWAAAAHHKKLDVISPELRDKINHFKVPDS
jgi:hypothetical protein